MKLYLFEHKASDFKFVIAAESQDKAVVILAMQAMDESRVEQFRDEVTQELKEADAVMTPAIVDTKTFERALLNETCMIEDAYKISSVATTGPATIKLPVFGKYEMPARTQVLSLKPAL